MKTHTSRSPALEVDRRSLLAAIAAFSLTGPAKAVEPWTWMWVLVKLAEGALSYAGGKIVGSLDGQPSASQLESSIRSAISDLQASLKRDFRKVIIDDRIRELEAVAGSVQINLDRYSFLDVRDRKKYKRLIETADVDTLRGIALAQQYDVAALPVRSMLISQRSIAMTALYQLTKSKSDARAYGIELASHAMRLEADLARYFDSLSPSARLGAIECEVYESSGGGFGVRTYTCSFAEDGKKIPGNSFMNFDPNNSDQRKAEVDARAEQLRNERTLALQTFKDNEYAHWFSSMSQVAGIWKETARKLSTIGRR